MPLTLNDLKPGSAGKIKGFADDLLANRMLSMGLLPGKTIEVIRYAPLGKGFYVKCNGIYIALRKQEATCILLN